mmetsp:Transcript_34747/g.40224  ORF Transcript_34747/g.40224 Transcript_34747/m.40224 type:complete len:85 (+) Transcript_34747:167-421(+)
MTNKPVDRNEASSRIPSARSMKIGSKNNELPQSHTGSKSCPVTISYSLTPMRISCTQTILPDCHENDNIFFEWTRRNTVTIVSL